MKRKYFASKKEARREMLLRDPHGFLGLGIYKMKKGTRHAGKYALCDYMEYLNTY